MKIVFFLLILFVSLIDIIQSDDFQNDDLDVISQPSYGLRTLDSVYDFQGARVKRSNITPKQKEQIVNGVKGAVAFFKFLEEKNFFKTLTQISSVAGPIFSIASAVISIAFLFIDIESPEMALMKKEFANLNNRIDRWGVEFREIKKMIEWSSVQVRFSDIENSILNLHKLVVAMPGIPEYAKENQRKVFMQKYETDYKSAGDTLYLAMIRVEQTYSENLFKASQKYTQYHRRKVQEFMVGMVQLLTQAIQIEAIYIDLKYNNNQEYADYAKSLWEKKLKVLESVMGTTDTQTKNQYVTQYHIDLDDTLKSYVSQSNEQFLTTLYNVLENKYDWRDWFVLVYKELSGFKDHTVSTCQGTHRFRSYGRNVIVSSIDKEDGNRAMSHIERNKVLIGSYTSWFSQKDFAKGWVDYINKNIPNCNDADTRAAVAWGANVWFMQTRLVVYKKNCVNNNSPCYNTFLFA